MWYEINYYALYHVIIILKMKLKEKKNSKKSCVYTNKLEISWKAYKMTYTTMIFYFLFNV